MKPTIVIGITGSIAAYKIVDLIRLLQRKGAEVHVVMTKSAERMIAPKNFKKVTKKKVYTELFPESFDYKAVIKKKKVEHIELAKKTDLVVIAPATANIIGKIASGIADCFLTTFILATEAPVVICPSMNTNMWKNPIVIKNVEKLKKLSYLFIEPSSGQLACGVEGVGKLADPAFIAKEIFHLLSQKNKLKGKKIMVTAGGTVELIDEVRTITNRSSGKMGVALAQACYQQGADVLLLRAGSSVASKTQLKEKTFNTGEQLSNLIKRYVKDYDVIFHVAAVSDFVLEDNYQGKIDSRREITLRLKPAPKICDNIKLWHLSIKLICFKAVYKKNRRQIISEGLNKLKQTKADYIVINDVGKKGIGFEVDDNEVYIVDKKGLVKKIDKAPKREVARQILSLIDF